MYLPSTKSCLTMQTFVPSIASVELRVSVSRSLVLEKPLAILTLEGHMIRMTLKVDKNT